ncbi:MAG: DUF4214 domain-containing protein [Deltaproteobacteria bacterium]|nr:DUF4214 domain-containing protein [Deltaproteobacteria bacterium]
MCDRGACLGDLRWHFARAVDLQWLQAGVVNPAELEVCATTAAEDLAAGRLLCDAWHAVGDLDARFGLYFGNSWWYFQDSQCGSDPAVALPCISAGLRAIGGHLHEVAPSLLLNAMLAEYVPRANLPGSSDAAWVAFCRPGSADFWGPGTCVPDLEHSAAARDYVVSWGRAFIDGGIRAFLFGEAQLTAGLAPGTPEVTATGALGLKDVIDRLKAYAATEGISRLYFGTQAADSVMVGGVQQIDFVTGAQHLQPLGGYLLQPLLPKGDMFPGSIYGDDDWHDANLTNATAFGLPVLLDYDNWSSTPAYPDDIRNLASVADNVTRARVLEDHWRHLRLYNPDAWLTIPVSKVLGDNTGITCQGVNQWHFSANACGLTAAARALFNNPDPARYTDVSWAADPPIRRDYWAVQLCGRDETVSWFYRIFLGRAPNAVEYGYWVGGVNLMGAGDRAALAWAFISSAELVAQGPLADGAFVDLLYRALLLREPDQGGHDYFTTQLASAAMSRYEVVTTIAGSAEAAGLYACPP